MSLSVHDRFEKIAGAIALGEATDDERREYREHIAACSSCLQALGGEREIERVVSTVSSARESEVWEPDIRNVVASRMQRRSRSLRFGFGVTGVALALSLGLHAVVASRTAPLAMQSERTLAETAGVTHITLDQRSGPALKAPAPQPQPQRRMIVQHNVVQIARAPLPAQAVAIPPPSVASAKSQDITNMIVHAPPQLSHKSAPSSSNIPPWRRGDSDTWHTVAQTTTTSLSESAPQTLTHRAELIQVYQPHVTRDAMPVGGETAINPQPPMIAYDEGAEGTTAFEVLIDDHGIPTKCVITKPAGYSILDTTVCRAAMQARYTPKTIDGRPVPGVYRDAFTFRMSQNDQNIEGVPKQIPQ